jgi:hypothetical protein
VLLVYVSSLQSRQCHRHFYHRCAYRLRFNHNVFFDFHLGLLQPFDFKKLGAPLIVTSKSANPAKKNCLKLLLLSSPRIRDVRYQYAGQTKQALSLPSEEEERE